MTQPAPTLPLPLPLPLPLRRPLARFFYANGDSCSTLYCRSGLRGSNSTGFPILPVYRSYSGLMQVRRPGVDGIGKIRVLERFASGCFVGCYERVHLDR